MENKTQMTMMIGVIVVLVLALFFSLGQKQIIVSNGDQVHKVSVSGSAQKDAMPDKAVLRLTVQNEGKDPKLVQSQNSETMNTVIAALKTAGVKDKEIETSGYNLYPIQDYDPTTQRMINRGYRLQNTMVVTTTNIDKVGYLLQIGVSNGINSVDSLTFSLSDEKEKQVKAELIADASRQAKDKAESLAENVGASLGKVLFVTESSYMPGIYYAERAMLTKADVGGMALSA